MRTQSTRHTAIVGVSMLALFVAAVAPATSVFAEGVTGDRIVNADKEPDNWLTNNRDYTSQRFSPLNIINKDNVKGMHLLYTVALNNAVPNYGEATPLAEDGFLYVTDTWGVVYKIDARAGNFGRIVWTMDPGQEKASGANRGVALGGDMVYSVANGPPRLIATNKDTGEEVWEKDVAGADEPRIITSGAPLLVKNMIIVPASGGDSGARDWLAAYDMKTGDEIWKKFNIPAPGEPGSETWKGDSNAWATGGGAMYVTGSYDPSDNQLYWGTGNPVPPYDPASRPGDNLFTNTILSRNPDNGDLDWYFQYTPNEAWDYDEQGTHILYKGKIDGEEKTLLTHSGRNGFLYSFQANKGLFVNAAPYLDGINWTKGIDPKTGKPLEYDPKLDVQIYNPEVHRTADAPTKKACPANVGGNNFWPSTYSPKTSLIYIPAITGCVTYTTNPDQHSVDKGFGGGGYVVDERLSSQLIAADPTTGEIKKKVDLKYPNYAGALSTEGDLVFTALTDGTVAAFDDQTLDELWSFNTGVGFTAPPMTFGYKGKQYVAIVSGLSSSARGKLSKTPELAEQRNAAMLYVFGL